MRRISILALILGLALGCLSACGDGDKGVHESLKIVLTHGNNSRPYLPWPAEVAKQVAGDLEDVGFEVEIDMQPWSSYIPYVENGRHQAAILGWSADVPDTDNFLSALLHEDSADHPDAFGPIACPRCARDLMGKVEFLVYTGIVLDHCDGCGGFWLDGSELGRINDYVVEMNRSSKELGSSPMDWLAQFLYALPR